MFHRGILFVAVLGAAVAAPYLLADANRRHMLAQWWQARSDSANERLVTKSAPDPLGSTARWQGNRPQPPTSSAVAVTTPAEGPPIQLLGQVFRFDVTPSWVISNWPRVTTHLVETQLEALRVALVTGTAVHDLAGSLTYYFDKQRQVQRISFHGHTGDAAQLVAFATGHFGLKPEAALGAGLYVSMWNGKPISALQIQHAAVVRSTQPHQRLQVDMELNRSDTLYGPSSTVKRLDQSDQRTRGWSLRSLLGGVIGGPNEG